MSENTGTITLEKQIIHLMMHSLDAVSLVAQSTVRLHHFAPQHRLLVEALFDAELKDAKLTRLSFDTFLESRHVGRKEKPGQMGLFSECLNYVDGVKQDDLHALIEKKRLAYVKEKNLSLLHEYQAGKETDELYAAKELVEQMKAVLDETEQANNISFNDIMSDEFWAQYDAERDQKKTSDIAITDCGLPELDSVMGCGFDPETLTVVCADVGGFKCLSSGNIATCDGSRVTVEDLWAMQNKGEPLPDVLSLNAADQVCVQSIQAIHDNGTRPVFRVRTRTGSEIVSTVNHRHRVLTGYRAVADLKAGDLIALARRHATGTASPRPGIPVWLGCMLSDGGCSQIAYRFTNFDEAIVETMRNACSQLNGVMRQLSSQDRLVKGEFAVNGTRSNGIAYGIDGKLSIEKSIHPSVFTWNRKALVELLRAMYGCDGSFQIEHQVKKNGSRKKRWRVQYHTSSHQLAKDVRDLLVKFGLIASIFEFQSKSGDHRRPAYRVILSDVRQVERFVREIGFFGQKQAVAEAAMPEMTDVKENGNNDLIPAEVWPIIERKMAEQGKSFYGCRRWVKRSDGKSGRGFEGSCGTQGRPLNRFLLRQIAAYLNNDSDLLRIANAEIYWDEIVSIEPAGEERVYDISMPVDHNFVCDGVVTHNSTMMLNIALNIWKRHKKDVLFVGLEMPKNRLMDKIMSREARIPFNYFQKPKNVWTEQHEEKLQIAKRELKGEGDNPGRFVLLEFGERTTVTQIKRQIEKHLSHFKPCVVVIDYIANLEPEADKRRRDRNDLEIGDMLKALLKMGKPGSVSKEGFGIVTGAQLNREALKRMKTYRGDATKYMFSSDDIQGSHQYAADATSIFCLYPDPANKARLFVFPVKNRYGQKSYADGSNKAALDVQPEYNLIESPTNITWKSEADNQMLVKAVSPPKLDDPWAEEDEPAPTASVPYAADEAFASDTPVKSTKDDSWDSMLEGE